MSLNTWYHCWLSIVVVLVVSEKVVGQILPPSWGSGDYIEAYVVAGTHDDVGWLKTPEEYYETEVRNILTTTIEALKKNPERKFMYVEMYYFQRWWTDIRTTEAQRSDLRDLLASKQWEFVEGGWVMPDEATTTFTAISDQLIEGHIFLNDTFGIIPSIGWQIDPFGASSTVAYLYHQAGFKYHVIDRINYKLKKQLIQEKSLEFNWFSSHTSLGDQPIFTHILDDNYCMPMLLSFDFEGNPFINPAITPDNIAFRAQEYATLVRQRQSYYQTNKVLILHQCDFAYQNAHAQFDNMDKIIKYINAHPQTFNMSIHWSRLDQYFDDITALKPNQKDWPSMSYTDFLPYDDNDLSWWTGYYTSRPGLKGLVREAEASLRLSDILSMPLYWQNKMSLEKSSKIDQILAKNDGQFHSLLKATGFPQSLSHLSQISSQVIENAFTPLRRAVAIAQHHDAVAGTETQDVAENYAQLLNDGQNLANEMNVELLTQISAGQLRYTDNLLGLKNLVPGGPRQAILIFNSLLWKRSEVIKLPIWSTDDIEVFDDNGKPITKMSVLSNLAPHEKLISPASLFVDVQNLPPGGFKYIFVGRGSSKNEVHFDEKMVKNDEKMTKFSFDVLDPYEHVELNGPSPRIGLDGPSIITNDYFTLKISNTSGLLDGLVVWSEGKNASQASNLNLTQNLMFYESYGGWEQPSGAYIFHPNGKALSMNPGIGASSIVRSTPFLSEIYQVFSSFAVQVIRQYAGYRYAEVSNWMGPIPGNTEVISRWDTNCKYSSNGNFLRDENGIPFPGDRKMKFDSNHLLTIPANYLPSVYAMSLPQTLSCPSLNFAFDRSHGVSSQFDNSIEFMIHRRTLQDDWRGLNEPLNDTSIVYTRQRLSFGSHSKSEQMIRSKNPFEINFPPKLFLASPISSLTHQNNNLYAPYTPFQDMGDQIQISLFRMIGKQKALVQVTPTIASGSGTSINVKSLVPKNFICQIDRTSLTGLRIIEKNQSSAFLLPGQIATFVITFC